MNIFKSLKYGNIREITKRGEPWFLAKDIALSLNIINHRQALSLLDNDEKSHVILNDGKGKRKHSIINESGLYSMILNSRKKEAKEFRKWITSEVLPSIRKTGEYEIPKEEREQSTKVRNSITDQWEDHGIKGHNFMNLTKHIKKISGLNKPKDQLTKKELAKLTAIEALESYKLMNSKDNGYFPLKDSVTNTVGLIEST